MHALWMVLAALLFASMGVCVKLGSAYFHPAEMIFWRGIIGMVLLWVLARSQGATLATAHPASTPGAAWWAWSRWAPGFMPSPNCHWPRP